MPTDDAAGRGRRSVKRIVVRIALAVVGLLAAAVLVFHFAILEPLPPASEPHTEIADSAFRGPVDEAGRVLAPLLDRFPSVSVAVGVDGRLVFSEARGWAEIDPRRPATPEVAYRIYSVTKPITATAAARLAEAGRLDLDAPIGRLLPSLPEAVRAITPRQLAGHLSGIRHYREGEISAWGETHCESVAEALPFFLDNDPVAHPPGERYAYSSYAYVLLSRVVEVASGRPYLDAIDELVLAPAGMTSTRLDDPRAEIPQAEIPQRAEFYIPMWLGRVMADPAGWDNTCKWGAGGLVATAEDLVRFAIFVTDSPLLAPETRELLFTPMRTTAGEQTPIGFGFAVETTASGNRVASHSGGAMGARSALHLRLDDRVVVALLANLIGDRLTDEAADVAELFAAHTRPAPGS